VEASKVVNSEAISTQSSDEYQGLWAQGWRRFKNDRLGYSCFFVVLLFFVISVAGWMNLLGSNWRDTVADPYAPPSLAYWEQQNTNIATEQSSSDAYVVSQYGIEDPIADLMLKAKEIEDAYQVEEVDKKSFLLFGADSKGRDILQKCLKGTSISVGVALFGAIFAVILGSFLGALAGYFGRWIDDVLMWFYSIFTSIPEMLLLLSFAVVFSRGVSTLIIIFALTSWAPVFRLVRAEFMKHKERDYIKAAEAIGASAPRKMFVHILPNVSHILLVQVSILMVGMIKSEVVLSFLGFGVDITQTSWGSMLAEVPAELLQGYWWQMLAVTLFMSVLVTAFNLMTDSLRDALDPKTD